MFFALSSTRVAYSIQQCGLPKKLTNSIDVYEPVLILCSIYRRPFHLREFLRNLFASLQQTFLLLDSTAIVYLVNLELVQYNLLPVKINSKKMHFSVWTERK